MTLLDKDGKPVVLGEVSLTTLTSLRNEVISGRLALPEFQRPQVWKDQEMKELVISLCLGVPIGSYLIWEFNQSEHESIEIVEFPGISTSKETVNYLLLDGQQRMSTIIGLTSSEFAISHKVEFRKISPELTRPIVHKIPGQKDTNGKLKKPYIPDHKTIKADREIQIAKLAGNAKINGLASDAKTMADQFRLQLSKTTVPVHTFEYKETRQWVLYVYQTCNLAGKPLSDTDHAEAALGYVYPELKQNIDNYVNTLTIWDKPQTPRKLILRSILDEIYKSPHFSYCKENGLDVLDPRIIEIKANLKKNISEKSDPLDSQVVEDALSVTKTAMTKVVDLISGSWQLSKSKGLKENELLVMLAWYRACENENMTPTKKNIGEMSKHMMLSMVHSSTTGGSTQLKTTKACNYVRKSITEDNSLSSCWNEIQNEWGYSDIVTKDFGKIAEEDTQVSKESLLFHLYRLSLFRDPKAVDMFDSTAIEGANAKYLQIDHFYPSSRLGHLSDKRLWKRRNHLGNFVIMKGWSNNSKKTKIPDSLITEKKLWPKTPDQKDNFRAHCIATVANDASWITKGQQSFDRLKKHKTKITKLTKAIEENKSATKAQIKDWEKEKKKLENEMVTISNSIEKQYTSFLGFRTQRMTKRINKMLKEIEEKGF